MRKEDTVWRCTLCNTATSRKHLGDEAKWGIFKCPSCGSVDCGVKECCQSIFVEVFESTSN